MTRRTFRVCTAVLVAILCICYMVMPVKAAAVEEANVINNVIHLFKEEYTPSDFLHALTAVAAMIYILKQALLLFRWYKRKVTRWVEKQGLTPFIFILAWMLTIITVILVLSGFSAYIFFNDLRLAIGCGFLATILSVFPFNVWKKWPMVFSKDHTPNSQTSNGSTPGSSAFPNSNRTQ